MYLIFDTETTGLPQDWKAPLTDFDNWPRMVQLAWQLHDIKGELIEVKNFIIKPEGFDIPFNAQQIHGISTEIANKHGISLSQVLEEFLNDVKKSKFLVGHNVEFDINIVGCELLRTGKTNSLNNFSTIDTKNESTDFCALPGGRGGKFKWPTLSELYQKLFNEQFAEAHNASADVEATTRCFLELIRIDVIAGEKVGMSIQDLELYKSLNNDTIQLIGLNIEAYKTESSKEESSEVEDLNVKEINESLASSFAHLHVHSQYSILQATSDIDLLVQRAVDNNMHAIGLTDHSNMFGSYKFINAVLNHPVNMNIKVGDSLKLKPILGCELNVCKDYLDKKNKDYGYQIPFLCKGKEGFHNLAKLSSISFVNGFYYVPRIDKKLMLEYKEGLIALTGSTHGIIPNMILNIGEKQAEEEFKWWLENFGDDFFVEINRHGLEEETYVNRVLIKFAKKYNVKIVASNNVYYLDKEDANSHDILLCVKEGELKSTPKGKGRGYRYGFPNNEFYFKSSSQMAELFMDIPEAISNIEYLTNKISYYKLNRDVLLPNFNIPVEFVNKEDELDGGNRGENKYLRDLTYKGAKERYSEITDDIKNRIDFELDVIENSGYPGYFLIVQDVISQARKMGVSVGPGRGSAAGSVVAYCIKITNIDPIKYDLLFERFLNPDRVSMPDIDIDFDDEGRGRVIDWVVSKYGKDNVAQIITYGRMAAKSSIRDTARVLDLPLLDADRIAKLMPDSITLSSLLSEEKDVLKSVKKDQISNAKSLISLSQGDDLIADTIKSARKIEGSLRNVGTHACGLIITPTPLTDLIPVTNAKDSDLMVTQFDNSVVEGAGLLKMDFLGLRNLTIIKDCIKIIDKLHDKKIDIDNITLDDEITFDLFQKGNTKGIFQFSSDGMRAHLKNLKPDKFDDLIAMNALYRPGPMEYIPNYIKRKHGQEDIEYDLPQMEAYLSNTYGITVYQEQVMLLSQKLANFSRGDADMLRKAMGKKIKTVLDKLQPKFISGCEENGIDIKVINKIWSDWEAFASYAFNKSHSTCYAFIAYQTAYLKAHYPAELMASILTNHMRDIKDITYYMEECKMMNIAVLSPDVNESFYKFSVNKKGEIRFGLGAVKGVGEAAVDSIINERKENGQYSSFEDFVKRVDLRTANKRTLESMACAGAFDSFGLKRSQYFAKEDDKTSYLEKMIKFGNKIKDKLESNQFDMFGDTAEATIVSPVLPQVEPWNTMELLSKEKEVVGIYLSGHPLDDYKLEVDNFCANKLDVLNDMTSIKGKSLRFAGVVTKFEHRETKNGKPFGILSVEDYTSNYSFYLFGDDYLTFKNYFTIGWALQIIGKVQKKFYNDDLEFKMSSIVLLSELIDKDVREMVVNIDLSDISKDLTNQLTVLVEKNKGKHSLIFNIKDSLNKYNVKLLSRNNKIDINKSFISEISKFNQLDFNIK